MPVNAFINKQKMAKEIISNKWIICRICLKTSETEMYLIFGEDDNTTDLAEQIADYGLIELSNAKTCPDRICERCLLLLKAAKKFRKLCQTSEKQWQELIQLNVKAGLVPINESNEQQLLPEVLDSTNFLEKSADTTESEKSLEVLEEQEKHAEEDAGDGYVFEVLDNDEDDCVEEADENMLAPHDAQYIELEDDDDGMEFLEDNSNVNSVELSYYSNSQFEDLNQEETLTSEPHSNNSKLFDYEQQLDSLKKNEELTESQEETVTAPECDTESSKRIVKRGNKKTTDTKKKYQRSKAKDSEDSQSEWTKKGTSNYVCGYCGNSYSEKAKLTLHLKIHTKEKPHECEICHKRFAQTPQLTRHMNSHTGNRPFKCKFCEASFADPSTCIKHQRIHTQERPYVCDTCGKAFSYSNVLKVHVMSHTGEKPYNCKYCDKKFTQSHHRRTHERTHL